MSDFNLFQEIEEDLERKKMEAIWKKYGPTIIAAAVAVVLATAVSTSWHSWKLSQEQKASSGFLSAISVQQEPAKAEGKEEKAEHDAGKEAVAHKIVALQDFAKAYPGTSQATFARLRAAGAAIDEGKLEDALGIYDALAQDDSVEPVFRELAQLLAVQGQMDKGDPATLIAKLEPLFVSDAWRFTAKEDAANLALKMGDKAKAQKWFEELSHESGVPQAMQGRAQDMLRWLGGQK